LTVSRIIKIVATSCQILRLKCSKFDFGWASAQTLLWELAALPELHLMGLLPRGDYGRE